MKRSTVVSLAATVALAVSGCVAPASSTTGGPESHRETATPTPPDPGGGSALPGTTDPQMVAPMQTGQPLPSTGPQYTVEQYLNFVVQDLDSKWTRWFLQNGLREPEVGYILIKPGETFTSKCRLKDGSRPVVTSDYPNAFYCSADDQPAANGRIYQGKLILPLVTFQKMWKGEVAGHTGQTIQDNDFAAAYVAAHEFGHHIQDELAQQRPALPALTGDNRELIADCFAGVWIYAMYNNRQLDTTDYAEAVNAAGLVGDARSGQGHGTKEQRIQAVEIGATYGAGGYPGGSPYACIAQYWK